MNNISVLSIIKCLKQYFLRVTKSYAGDFVQIGRKGYEDFGKNRVRDFVQAGKFRSGI